MSDSPTGTAAGETALFDRYTLPKVALTVILVASLVGTWVTTTLNGHGGGALAVARWAYFVALGVLTGGFLWKHGFVRPADLDEGAAEYCAAMYDRFDRIAAGALAVLAAGGAVALLAYVEAGGWTAPVIGVAVLLAACLLIGAVTTYRDASVDKQFRSLLGLAALAAALGLVAATAVAEVAARGFDPAAVGIRVIHLLAFAVWLGGAVWNIYVAVPTGQEQPTVPVVRAAGEQLERFRWAVRFIIPTLLLTGFLQAIDGLGTQVGSYLGSAVGLAVVSKLGFVGVLFVIFKLCPMWRACSPIEGVCELDDLGGDASTQQTDAGEDGEVPGDD